MRFNMETNERRILVCVSPAPSSHKLIHIASQMASTSNASWAAVLVMEKQDREKKNLNWQRGMDNLAYAKELGAEIQAATGYDIARQLALYAKKWGATKLILGYSVGGKKFSL